MNCHEQERGQTLTRASPRVVEAPRLLGVGVTGLAEGRDLETARRSAVDDRLELVGVVTVVAGVAGVFEVWVEAVEDEEGVKVRLGG